MAVAKERVVEATTVERIPSKMPYAFLEIQVKGTVDEFLAYRTEALAKHPDYGHSDIPKTKTVAAAEQAEVTPSDVTEGAQVEELPPVAAAPTEGLSARDVARAKILAKRAEGSK